MKVIGIGGFARSGKDTFVSIAKDILGKNGYHPQRYAFADQLKQELDTMLRANNFQIDIYSDKTEVKTKQRPLLVWWGCTRRDQSPDGNYWVNKVHETLQAVQKVSEELGTAEKAVALISDVRFINEAKWVQGAWDGKFVHIRRYRTESGIMERIYDTAPNQEEANNDPLIRKLADFSVEWESRPIPTGGSAVEDPVLRRRVLTVLNEIFSGVNGGLND
jgi:hypothetical protein